MSGILAKYNDLRVHLDRQRTIDLQTSISEMSSFELQDVHVGSHRAGQVFLLESNGDPKVICEMVVSHAAGDSIATLYHGHPIFNNRGAYLEAREEMVNLILDLADAGTLGVLVQCPVRGRATHVRDLSFKQLVELAQGRVNRVMARH